MTAVNRTPPPDELREQIYYKDGALYFHEGHDKRYKRNQGKPIGYRTKDGYLRVRLTVNGAIRAYLVHRLIYWLEKHDWPVSIDHKDRNRSNNLIDNLKPATLLENNRNTSIRKDNATGYTGVERYGSKYKVKIKLDDRAYVICGYESLEAAALARDILAKIFFGDFARFGILDNAALKVGGITI